MWQPSENVCRNPTYSCHRLRRQSRRVVIRRWSGFSHTTRTAYALMQSEGYSLNRSIPKRWNYQPFNDKLSDFRGKPGVGAGVFRPVCRTLPGETGKETGKGERI